MSQKVGQHAVGEHQHRRQHRPGEAGPVGQTQRPVPYGVEAQHQGHPHKEEGQGLHKQSHHQRPAQQQRRPGLGPVFFLVGPPHQQQKGQKHRRRHPVVPEAGHPAVHLDPHDGRHQQNHPVGRQEHGQKPLPVPSGHQRGHQYGDGEHAPAHEQHLHRRKMAHEHGAKIPGVTAVEQAVFPPAHPLLHAPLQIVGAAVGHGPGDEQIADQRGRQNGPADHGVSALRQSGLLLLRRPAPGTACPTILSGFPRDVNAAVPAGGPD